LFLHQIASKSPDVYLDERLILESFMSIYVGNLSYSVTQDDLEKVFSEYGGVKRVQLPTDRETGRVRGFGFVEMETDAAETAAINALDGAEWMGRVMKVNKARPREEKGGRSGGNNWSKGDNNSYSRRY
jgi:RNA recognition motif-containing protein